MRTRKTPNTDTFHTVLSGNLQRNPKLFADDTSFFPTVRKSKTTANNFNNDLKEISNYAFQWKMSFNPDPSKQSQEVIYSKRTTKVSHSKIFFNNVPVFQVDFQNHAGLILDSKLTFGIHIKLILAKVNKTIGLIIVLPRASLMLHKIFFRLR